MDVTSVANMATLMAQGKALTEIGYAVMDMQMDDMKMEGAEVAQLISTVPSVDPNIGGNIDVSV
ncbi:MAG: YjfB family protein [Lachnospiraceae bacterium]|nr:YjfB family protein [Lachnospiraceae bacterium]